MTKIACDVIKCSYNKHQTCYAKQILITEQGVSNYEKTCCNAYLNEQTYANLAEYTTQEIPLDTVHCKVGNCKHYQDEYCTLAAIHIEPVGGGNLYIETFCKSFEER